jgi:hypothetical protein
MNREFRKQFNHIYSIKNLDMGNPYNMIAILSWYNSWASLIDTNYGSFPLFVADMNNYDENYSTFVKIYKICKVVSKNLTIETPSGQCTIA